MIRACRYRQSGEYAVCGFATPKESFEATLEFSIVDFQSKRRIVGSGEPAQKLVWLNGA